MGEKGESGYEAEPSIVVTPHTLVVTLSERQQQEARDCLERSGKVSFSMKEVSVTRLPDTLLAAGVIID